MLVRGRHFLSRYYRLTPARKILCLEAALYLSISRLAIATLPFKTIRYFLDRVTKLPELQGDKRRRIREDVAWAVNRIPGYLPGKTVCFPRGMAAQAMLRRRRIGTRLYFGSTTLQENSLTSHVWVKDGEHPVTGCLEAPGYKVIAQYPKIH